MTTATPLDLGQLVRVRGQQWVVSDLNVSRLPIDELAATTVPGRTLVTITSVSEDDLGEELTVVWEVEPGRVVVPSGALPDVPDPERWDDPQTLGALIDAVRWGSVASADVSTLQAPFRAGIQIKDYELEPVAKALRMPRVALLIADDVGLGKTIEAGLVVQEMLLRHRARRVLVVCPASLTLKWREEMRDKFGLDFTVLDASALKELRRTHGLQANPFTVYPRMIISLPWLRTPRVQRLLDEVLDDTTQHPGFFDLLVVDEAHHVAPPAPVKGRRGYAVDSLQTRAVRLLSRHSQHRVLLSATPHNGYSESWQALLEVVDPRRFARGVEPDAVALREVLVRRLKDEKVDRSAEMISNGRARAPRSASECPGPPTSAWARSCSVLGPTSNGPIWATATVDPSLAAQHTERAGPSWSFAGWADNSSSTPSSRGIGAEISTVPSPSATRSHSSALTANSTTFKARPRPCASAAISNTFLAKFLRVPATNS